MWAHYGDNHKGICLEINKELFIKENSKKYDFNLFKEVEYFEFDRNNLPEHKNIDHSIMNEIGMEKYLKEYFRKEHLDFLFFTKNKEWESESEIRLLHFSDTDDNEYCTINKSLKNIHLGINFNMSNLSCIQDLISDTDIEIIGTEYGDFGLIFKKVNNGSYR